MLRVIWVFFRVGAMNELHYRANFLLQLVQSLVAFGTGLAGLWIVFNQTSTLDGWSQYELLAMMGVYTLIGGLISTVVQPNMERLMADIEQGTLDYALTKPLDVQVMISVREIRIWQSVDILTGLAVLAFAVAHLHSGMGVLPALSFFLMLVLGALMIYSFWLILTTAAFWVVRAEPIVNLFQGVYAAGRYPVGIYPTWLQAGLTFLVPVAFAVTVPSEALTGRLTAQTVLGTALLAALFLALSRFIWMQGLRRYAGASS